MEFLGVLFIVIVVFIVGSFILSLNKDKNELQDQPLEKKFRGFVHMINNAAFDGTGSVSVIDKRSFNLYRKEENQIINFHYGTGHLTITWRYKFYQKEVVHKRSFNDVRNLSVLEQQELAERMIMEMEHIIEKHKSKVLESVHRLSDSHNSQVKESIGVDLSSNYQEVENSNFGVKKETMTVLTAMNILKNRTQLKEGLNKNIQVIKVDFKGSKLEEPYAIVFFNATNKRSKQKAIEYLQEEEYQEACDLYESLIVNFDLGKKLERVGSANIIVKLVKVDNNESGLVKDFKIINAEPFTENIDNSGVCIDYKQDDNSKKFIKIIEDEISLDIAEISESFNYINGGKTKLNSSRLQYYLTNYEEAPTKFASELLSRNLKKLMELKKLNVVGYKDISNGLALSVLNILSFPINFAKMMTMAEDFGDSINDSEYLKKRQNIIDSKIILKRLYQLDIDFDVKNNLNNYIEIIDVIQKKYSIIE